MLVNQSIRTAFIAGIAATVLAAAMTVESVHAGRAAPGALRQAAPGSAQPGAAQPPMAAPTTAYVGSQACRRCHAQTYERWSKTRMANVVRDPREHPEAVPHRRVLLTSTSLPAPVL